MLSFKYKGLIFQALYLVLVVVLLPEYAASELLRYNFTTTSIITSRELLAAGGCNLFQGRWVVDPSYPLYESSSCPFIDPEFDCIKYGRPDKQYLKFSWKPDSCDLPRYVLPNITFVCVSVWFFLDTNLRTSFLRFPAGLMGWIFSRGWEEDNVCGRLTEFESVGVSCLYDSCFCPQLKDQLRETGVAFVRDIPGLRSYPTTLPISVLGRYNKRKHWGEWDYIQDGSTISKDMNRLVAFYKGLTTWARWVELNVDPSKTKVFFQGISPTHYRGRDWKSASGNCNGEQQPLTGSTYPAGTPPEVQVVSKVLSRINKPVYLLDITTLSQLRKDAHPSAYSGDHSGVDCSHWCLPGLPDTWNQLLYAALVM
ncbi:UNVERIFIED_CONTAM: protein trichome birefringence-like 38 [Sesamum angustifolium]|uniref:Protein trichome birefringence-like 38 n=1 Tax=Sesamum angustifolium TaxID=2727405 RepID=A0AAW2P9L7_9LAMI